MPKKNEEKKYTLINILSLIVLISSIVYFIISLTNGNQSKPVSTLISSLLLVLFTLIYVTISITYKRKNKRLLWISNLLFLSFYTFGIASNMGTIDIDSSKRIQEFQGKTLSYATSWATKNKVELETIYEYSDIIPEYHIISQNIEVGTKTKDVKKIVLAISEGANPYKEIIIPNMVSWNSEKVLDYIEDNYLSNVIVEFVSSEKASDTVIEQSVSGTVKRNDEIKLTFSYGEQRDYDEVKLIDLTNLSKFRAEFYLKQHNLRYEFEEDFHKSIKKGFVMKQDKAPGEMVKIDDEKIKVTISKGPEIKVPDLKEMSLDEITDWIIQNKLKLKYTDKYDDTVKENKVIEANYKTGEIISQGSLIELVLSKGKLKMKEFASLNEFKEWADKYQIPYEEQHEFSDTVPAGEVISYSIIKGQKMSKGDTITNNTPVIILISDGKKLTVPDLVGLTKNKITQKLDELGLNYNFVYKSSDTVAEGKAIKQSISSDSEVSSGTTITITISTGKEQISKNNSNTNNNTTKNNTNNQNSNNSSSNNQNSNNNENNNNSQNTQPVEQKEENKCVVTSCTIGGSIRNVINNSSSYYDTESGINDLMSSKCPGVKYEIIPSTDSGMSPGSIVSGIGPTSKFDTCTTSPYKIVIAK